MHRIHSSPIGVVGRMMSFSRGPRRSEQRVWMWWGTVIHSKTLYNVCLHCLWIVPGSSHPFFFFFSFHFWVLGHCGKTFKYSLATRMCWDRRTNDSRSLKDRMHILRSTSMISKFEVIMWTATLVYFRPHTMYRPIYETDMDKVMVCATCFGSFQCSLFPILFVLVLAMSMCHSWPHNTPIELVHSQSGPRESGWEGIVGHEHISHSSMLKKINMSFWEFLLHHLSYSMSRTIFVKGLN